MSYAARGLVVVDTGVFGARLSPRGNALAWSYQPLLEGRATVPSFVTLAELRFGAKLAGWGPSRFQHLEYELGRVNITWPGEALADVYADLRTWCVRAGHGLGQKDHEADRWVAATAMWLDAPVVAHGSIFANVEGLSLLTKLGL